ncbi:hypothetical protein P4C99_13805 [Pontiellaceae bacterium B1224]|nr:hypothetical protein [Pontiellaceae bacterium B1224]
MDDKIHAKEARSDARDVILDLNFVPQWAKKPPGENHYSKKEYREERPRRRDDRSRGGDRRPSGRNDERPRRPQSDRRNDSRSERPERRREPREPIKELPVTVSFLPEQKRLASLVRQIHHSRRAYPLMDLANLMIHDSEGYLVKIECNKDTPAFELFQCKKCKSVASTEEMIVQHIKSKHLTDVYDKEEIEIEPPAGSFPGVARCRKSGILLGPPNHHSYTEKVAEVHATRFPNMSLEDYKRNIEIVKDDELVEQWKEESRKQTVYKLKSDPEAEPLDLKRAEIEFSKKIPSMYERTHRAVVPAKISQSLEDRDVTHAIKQVWGKESRFPLTMSFSMRAAFRHMHLYLFKAGKINFVTHIKPNPVKPEDTVPNICEVLMFLKENPGSNRLQLLEVLHPSLDPKSEEAKHALQPLGWLIERGHIIEFFNGNLSVPLGHRRH